MTPTRLAVPIASWRRLAVATWLFTVAAAALCLIADPARGAAVSGAHGHTTIALSPNVQRELARAGITLTAGPPAQHSGSSWTLPLSNGTADPASMEVSGTLAGSLVFGHGRRSVVASSLSEHDGKAAWIRSRLGSAGLHTFIKLRLGTAQPTVSAEGLGTTISDMQATISGIAAHALDVALHTRLFSAGMEIGTASTVATFGQGSGGGN